MQCQGASSAVLSFVSLFTDSTPDFGEQVQVSRYLICSVPLPSIKGLRKVATACGISKGYTIPDANKGSESERSDHWMNCSDGKHIAQSTPYFELIRPLLLNRVEI
ncbi:hypothetical protein BDW68DRAFT_151918 [Aspergillus falconensis]